MRGQPAGAAARARPGAAARAAPGAAARAAPGAAARVAPGAKMAATVARHRPDRGRRDSAEVDAPSALPDASVGAGFGVSTAPGVPRRRCASGFCADAVCRAQRLHRCVSLVRAGGTAGLPAGSSPRPCRIPERPRRRNPPRRAAATAPRRRRGCRRWPGGTVCKPSGCSGPTGRYAPGDLRRRRYRQPVQVQPRGVRLRGRRVQDHLRGGDGSARPRRVPQRQPWQETPRRRGSDKTRVQLRNCIDGVLRPRRLHRPLPGVQRRRENRELPEPAGRRRPADPRSAPPTRPRAVCARASCDGAGPARPCSKGPRAARAPAHQHRDAGAPLRRGGHPRPRRPRSCGTYVCKADARATTCTNGRRRRAAGLLPPGELPDARAVMGNARAAIPARVCRGSAPTGSAARAGVPRPAGAARLPPAAARLSPAATPWRTMPCTGPHRCDEMGHLQVSSKGVASTVSPAEERFRLWSRLHSRREHALHRAASVLLAGSAHADSKPAAGAAPDGANR